jgi:NitT/TauT family transport system ATP-binding protein
MVPCASVGEGAQVVSPPPSAGRPLIEAEDVAKIYVDRSRRAVRALEHVSFHVDEGEFVSLLGPSGCGKSTMLLMTAGLLSPSAGTIRIRGNRVSGPQTDIGIVFQSDVLLEWRTALGNVLLQLEARGDTGAEARARAQGLLQSIGLGGFHDVFPHELSGGMRQRVSICRALVHEPDVLLMDEPFGSLDAITRDQLGLDLARLWDERRHTALFITHSISEAVFLSDRIIVMTPRPGRVDEIVEVHLPRPRTLAVRETDEFRKDVTRIKDIFVAGGVLHDAVAVGSNRQLVDEH